MRGHAPPLKLSVLNDRIVVSVFIVLISAAFLTETVKLVYNSTRLNSFVIRLLVHYQLFVIRL